MKRMSRGLKRTLQGVVLGIAFSAPLAACGPLQMPVENRSGDDQWVDTKIKSGILGDFAEVDHSYLIDVNVDIWKQQVMVTGMVDSKGKYYDVMSIIRQDKRIKTVYDHLQVADAKTVAEYRDAEQKYGEDNAVPADSAKQSVSDAWIESQIKALLLAEKGVRSVNYRWQSVSNIVYIMGESANKTEYDKVLSIVRRIKGVTKVVSHVSVVG
ncbi:BON domain-containing protein [Thalassospira marina]|uniref:BON domain-containing protein n=1 Tax=Thalassospira marina TaxID=2048283 RepID=A0ABM6Q9S8_9PROT|nr:BON domain-containing protein [Thalassospira marina]AUG53297.1 BON domain-containing protein [Thalassospira marina]